MSLALGVQSRDWSLSYRYVVQSAFVGVITVNHYSLAMACSEREGLERTSWNEETAS